ncbi:MAG: ABC transporter ATP-binding protein [Candidatus Pacebacteria bacterium]|nr:ABC transporter ATP-binding protein [Candidatus Paceibacterota bacterium]MBP9867077.1 ABC transporter ATP-binding protein [Candidatus Paceibacterota bacterium]
MSEITISNVSKWYGTKTKGKYSVKNLNLSIKKGSVFGFLGPNGAGKTTTIKMLVGLAKPTEGTITIGTGKPDDMHVKQKIGFMPESPSFYLYLTGREFLTFIAEIFALQQYKGKINELLESVELLDAADRQIRTYSKGMLQRLGLAQALINDPDILFLDEPLDGLDPLGRAEIKKIILQLKGKNKTIFLNSHILSDVAELCDQVGIIDKGELLIVDSPKNITANHKDLEEAFVSLITTRRTK